MRLWLGRLGRIVLCRCSRPICRVRLFGWQFRTNPRQAAAIRAARKEGEAGRDITPNEALVLTIIAYMQPVTRGAISRFTGREVSRDLIARLHRQTWSAQSGTGRAIYLRDNAGFSGAVRFGKPSRAADFFSSLLKSTKLP